MANVNPATRKTTNAAARTDDTTAPAKPQSAPAAPKAKPADAYAEVAHQAPSVGTVKLLVSSKSTGEALGTEQLEALKTAAQAAGGKVIEENGMFASTALVELPAAVATQARAVLGGLPGVELVAVSELSSPARGKGSAVAAEVLAGLKTGTLPQRLETARALLERLRADGPSAFEPVQRGEMAAELYDLYATLSGTFDTLWKSSFTEIAGFVQKTLEGQGAAIDWSALRGAARQEQQLPQHTKESDSVRGTLKGMSETLALLDTPRSLGILENLMSAARNAGTSYLLDNPAAAQKVFSNWLTVAETRIDQSDFSTEKVREGYTQPMQGGGYESLTGTRNAWGRHERSIDYPFERTGSGPLLLLTGSQSAELARQLVDFVTRNEGKIPGQAAQREQTQQGIEQRTIERMITGDMRERVTPANIQSMVEDRMVEYRQSDAMIANPSLDTMIMSVRRAMWGTFGAADVKTYAEVAVPLMSELLERAKTPGLLPLIVDEALQLLSMVKANEVDVSTEKLVQQLGPFVRLAELKTQQAGQDRLADPVAEKARTAAQATEVMDLLQAELTNPTVPALASVVKEEAHAKADWYAGIAQYGHLAGHDDVAQRARTMRDATA